MLLSTLGLGFLVGMQHATEIDHVAAVSSIASQKSGMRAITRHGFYWGVGHTITLLLVGGACLVVRTSVPDDIGRKLEAIVGIMLVVLGLHVLFRVWRDRIHFHMHRHGSGAAHFHAHSHKSDNAPHVDSAHRHEHPDGVPWRTIAVGLVHGMAGSAALVAFTAARLTSPWWGLVYILIFGAGTAAGMALFSAIIAAPVTLTARSLTFANRTFQVAVGIFTCLVGMRVLIDVI